jgi:hypothetical protein
VINAATTGASFLNAGIQALNPTGSKTSSSSLCHSLASTVGLPEDAASAVCTFSEESLGLLGDAADSGVQAVADAVDDAGEWITETVNSATRGAVSLYKDIANLADSGVDAVSDAADAVGDGVGAAANTLSSYGALALAAGGALLSGVS